MKHNQWDGYSKLSSRTIGMDAVDDFYMDHLFVDWNKTMQDKYILNIFQEGLIFGLDDCQFW